MLDLQTKPHSRTPSNHKKLILGTLAGAFVLGGVVLLVANWPFRQDAVFLKLSQSAFNSQVTAVSFRRTYFPHPGCVLKQVVFRHSPLLSMPPLITVDTLRIDASFTGLFNDHLRRIQADGIRVLVPPVNTGKFVTPPRSAVVVDQLVATGLTLEVASRNAARPNLKFFFHAFTLSNVGATGPAVFNASFTNPEPPGEIATSGHFGPWREDAAGQTPVSGRYQFTHADLGVFGGIAGMLSSSGTFSGVLHRIQVEGRTDTPNFAVKSSSHSAPLEADFHASVDAGNGDVTLESVTSSFRDTTIDWQGSVAASPGQPGKTAAIDFVSRQGRIQDLLLLFIKAPLSPMSGLISFRGKAVLPPGQDSFLRRVKLNGEFGIDSGRFTNPTTQQDVQHLSEGAQGKDIPKSSSNDQKSRNDPHPDEKQNDDANILSDLKGSVVLANGLAHFAELSFSVPGALTRMHGTYNLVSEAIDLHGVLITQDEPGKTTTGMKTVILTALSPFLKKKQVGYKLPIKITGTYDHPSFGPDFDSADKKPRNQKAERALFPRTSR